MAGSSQNCQTQTCDSPTMRGREYTCSSFDCVGQVEGEIPGYPVTASRESSFACPRISLLDVPQAGSFTLQKQTNLVFYAFGIWHSKTRVSRGLLDGSQSSGVL